LLHKSSAFFLLPTSISLLLTAIQNQETAAAYTENMLSFEVCPRSDLRPIIKRTSRSSVGAHLGRSQFLRNCQRNARIVPSGQAKNST